MEERRGVAADGRELVPAGLHQERRGEAKSNFHQRRLETWVEELKQMRETALKTRSSPVSSVISMTSRPPEKGTGGLKLWLQERVKEWSHEQPALRPNG